MKKDQLSSELENLLKDYKFRISKLELDWPHEDKKEAPASVSLESWRADMPALGALTPPSRSDPPDAIEQFLASQAPPAPPTPSEKAPVKIPAPAPAPTQTVAPSVAAAKRGAAFKSGLILLGILAAWGLGKLLLPINQAQRSFPLPVAKSAGLIFNDGRLFLVDTEKQRLLSFKPGSVQPEPEGEFSNPDLGGIAWADGRFWSTDPEKGAIYQHGIDTAYSIRRSYPQPARHPFSIFSDGEYIWVGDSKTDEVYQYLLVRSLTGTSLTPLGRLQLPGIRPVAIHIAAGKLWALDGLSHKVFRYKLEASRAVALDSADLSHWLPLSRRLTGMALNNQAVWVTTADPVELHRIEAQSLRWKK